MEELKPGFRAACTFMQYGASGGHHEGTLLVFVDSDRPAVVLMPRPGSVVPPVKIDASSITGSRTCVFVCLALRASVCVVCERPMSICVFTCVHTRCGVPLMLRSARVPGDFDNWCAVVL